MLRFIAAIALGLASGIAPAQAGEAAPVTIGTTQVQIAVPDGYLRGSEKAPSLYATSAAALPPAIRLAEMLVDEADLKRMLVGQTATDPYLQVQVVRDAEALEFSAQEWAALQPTLAAQLGATNLDAATRELQAGMGERMGAASGASVEIAFGEVGKPQVYSQEGGVVRFAIRLPITGNVNGQPVQMVVDCAGAALLLNGKLLMLNAYLVEDEPQASMARVRAFLAELVERSQALNAAQASQGGEAETGTGAGQR
jgi:hypothetical protein